MLVTVQRAWYTEKSTCGMLALDGIFECFTLEPRRDQSQGKPFCIPAGTYDVIVEQSPRFQQPTPHLQNVPGFDYIELHPGNFPGDTHGCTLVGQEHATDDVSNSRAAFEQLMSKLPQKFQIVYIDDYYENQKWPLE